MINLLLLATISVWRMGGDINIPNAPNGAALRTMGGDIHVGQAAGHLVAKTMGGNIEIRDLQGSALASTMGGNVSVNVEGSGAGHDLDLYTMGGDIVVTLPANFDGQFSVETEGEQTREQQIISEFPLNIRESTRWRFFGGSRFVRTATGRTGSGASRVQITTLGGNITIRKK